MRDAGRATPRAALAPVARRRAAAALPILLSLLALAAAASASRPSPRSLAEDLDGAAACRQCKASDGRRCVGRTIQDESCDACSTGRECAAVLTRFVRQETASTADEVVAEAASTSEGVAFEFEAAATVAEAAFTADEGRGRGRVHGLTMLIFCGSS